MRTCHFNPNRDAAGASDSSIGLVLSGGGAKGAYQAGVWKALAESGIIERIDAISGTSVGAINAVAFAVIKDPDRINTFWHDNVSEIATPNLEVLSFAELLSAFERIAMGVQFPFQGLLRQEVLESVLRDLLPLEWPAKVPNVYSTALKCIGSSFEEFNRKSYRLVRFWLNGEKDAEIRLRKILASCAIPWCFNAVEIGDKRFIDGGWDAYGGDNLPIKPILKRHPDIKTIIAIRCNSADIEPDTVMLHHRPDIKIIEIRPSRPLRGLFADEMDTLGYGNVPNDVIKWAGSLAFRADLTDAMFFRGYEDGHEVLEKL